MSENTALAVTDTLAQVKDTVAQAGKESDWIMHHILNGKELDFLPFGIIHLPELNFFGYDLLTKHSVFMASL